VVVKEEGGKGMAINPDYSYTFGNKFSEKLETNQMAKKEIDLYKTLDIQRTIDPFKLIRPQLNS
jgi:hypothetical protein